jgi:hypothetical protein
MYAHCVFPQHRYDDVMIGTGYVMSQLYDVYDEFFFYKYELIA